MNRNHIPRTTVSNPHKSGKRTLDLQHGTSIVAAMLFLRQRLQTTLTKRIFLILIGSSQTEDVGLMSRYGFLQVPAGNCAAPESRNQDVFVKENGLHKGKAKGKVLSRSKRDILLQPRNADDEKMTAKELERTKKWREMAIAEQPNGSLHYRFPVTKKVLPHRSIK